MAISKTCTFKEFIPRAGLKPEFGFGKRFSDPFLDFCMQHCTGG
jgi:hypothetical protein